MEFEQVVKTRRSIRKYKDTPVPEEIVKKVMDLTLKYAPSAKNLQPWKFLVISNPELKTQIFDCCKRQGFVAPYIVVGLADSVNNYTVIGNYMHSDVMDLSIAFTTLTLAATNAGLATCWIGAFDSARVEKLLDIRHPWRVLAFTPLGYADEPGTYAARKPEAEVLEWIR